MKAGGRRYEAGGGKTRELADRKSERFAARIVRLCRFLQKEKGEYTLSNQLLRSGTSIGANLAEAVYAMSGNDFLSRQYIALKETSETMYWLRLLYRTDYFTEEQYHSIYSDAEELQKMLASSTKSLKERRDRSSSPEKSQPS